MSERVIGKLLRIFVDEDDRINGRPAHLAIVEAMVAFGFSGATVLKGIEGFGRSRRLRAARAMDQAMGLPVLIEVIDDEVRIAAFLPKLESLMHGGLVTLERIESIHVVRENAP